MDEEWDAFLTKRAKSLPVLPKITHHGHQGHGPIDKNHIPRFIFRCFDTWKFYWDLGILLLSVGITFLLPIEIAYHPPFGE